MNIIHIVVRILPFLSLAIILSGCATTTLTCYPPTPKHAGVLRVAEIMDLTRTKELSTDSLQILRNSGITETQIQSGLIGIGRVYCCGSDNEQLNILTIFIPEDVAVEVGDIIEVKMGETPFRSKPGFVNTAIRVREKNDNKEMPRWGISGHRSDRICRWIPDNPRLWNRILYCDWMREEGWIESNDFIWDAWIKP